MRWLVLTLLGVGCGGIVDGETESESAPAPEFCHVVRGYFGDQGCRFGQIEFSSCEPPEYAYAIRDFKCTLVRFEQ